MGFCARVGRVLVRVALERYRRGSATEADGGLRILLAHRPHNGTLEAENRWIIARLNVVRCSQPCQSDWERATWMTR